ncbi:MAG TPA: hypothetical protein VH170_02585 [Chthoniobacterales bacterium]|nr:hypothetical protein [Chthoniobacterales bacterium]
MTLDFGWLNAGLHDKSSVRPRPANRARTADWPRATYRAANGTARPTEISAGTSRSTEISVRTARPASAAESAQAEKTGKSEKGGEENEENNPSAIGQQNKKTPETLAFV